MRQHSSLDWILPLLPTYRDLLHYKNVLYDVERAKTRLSVEDALHKHYPDPLHLPPVLPPLRFTWSHINSLLPRVTKRVELLIAAGEVDAACPPEQQREATWQSLRQQPSRRASHGRQRARRQSGQHDDGEEKKAIGERQQQQQRQEEVTERDIEMEHSRSLIQSQPAECPHVESPELLAHPDHLDLSDRHPPPRSQEQRRGQVEPLQQAHLDREHHLLQPATVPSRKRRAITAVAELNDVDRLDAVGGEGCCDDALTTPLTNHDAEALRQSTSEAPISAEGLDVADTDLGHSISVSLEERKASNDRREQDVRSGLEGVIAQLRTRLTEALDRASGLEVDIRQLTSQLQQEQDLRLTSDMTLQQVSTQLAEVKAHLESARSQSLNGESRLQAAMAESEVLRRDLESSMSQRHLLELAHTQQIVHVQQQLADAR